MPSFDSYVMRHGEAWVQHLIEQLERREGMRRETRDLEARWNTLMGPAPLPPRRMAA